MQDIPYLPPKDPFLTFDTSTPRQGAGNRVILTRKTADSQIMVRDILFVDERDIDAGAFVDISPVSNVAVMGPLFLFIGLPLREPDGLPFGGGLFET